MVVKPQTKIKPLPHPSGVGAQLARIQADSSEPTAMRLAQQDDLPGITELRKDCYPSGLSEDEIRQRFTQNPRFQLERDTWVKEGQSGLEAMAVVLPLQAYLTQGIVDVAGIASVAVHPVRRRQGLARSFLEQLLRQASQPVSALFAFEYAFYRRLGFAPVVRAQLLQVAPRDLPYHASAHQVVADPSLEIARQIYAQQESKLGRLALVRKVAFWDRLANQSDLRSYACSDGYILYRHRPSLRQPLTSELEVLEWLATTPAGWKAVTGHLNLLQEQVTRISLPMAADSALSLGWVEPRQTWASQVRGEDYTTGSSTVGMMLRWRHPIQALEARTYPRAQHWNVCIGVEDPLDLCSGSYQLDFESGRLQAKVTDKPADLLAGVGTWTQLWCGACNLEEALAWGDLRGPENLAQHLVESFQVPHRPYTHEQDNF